MADNQPATKNVRKDSIQKVDSLPQIDNETPRPAKYKTPTLTFLSMIASDPTGNLRDPSSVVQDPVTKRWHFWVDYMKGGEQPGWHASLHHYSAAQIEGSWTNHPLNPQH